MVLALDRLFEFGHRTLALVMGGSILSANSSWRLQIMNEFCLDRIMFFSEDLCIKCEMSVSSLDSVSQARTAMRKFLSKDTQATTIVASNDNLAWEA